MVAYRRNRVAGGTYFFTVTLQDRTSTRLVEHMVELRPTLRSVMRERPFRIDAMVVMPDHMHAVWSLPPGDDDYAGRWRLIKSRFTRSLVRAGVKMLKNEKGEYDLWQRRYWEYTIRNESDLVRHVDYIHFNPVKHGLVTRVCDRPHSTFHHYVKAGIYPLDWAGVVDEHKGGFGE
ncbi:MAG: transposase [Gammaproteobacteria bacterium]|nr:transposase [Gammaproteobacteria bacterium]